MEVGQKQRKGLAGMETLDKRDVSAGPPDLKDVLKELVVCILNCFYQGTYSKAIVRERQVDH